MSKEIDSLSNAIELLELAERLEDDDNLEEALEATEKAIKLDPQNGKAWCKKASLLLDMDKPAEAYQVLIKACEDMPENTDCIFELGAFSSEHGNINQACGCFHKVYQLNPNYPRIKINLGYDLIKLGIFKDAIKYLEEALKDDLSDMDRARVLNRLGEAHMNNLDPKDPENEHEANREQLEKAKECFDKSIQLDDSQYVPVGNMAMCYVRLGDPQEAVKILEPVLAKFPNEARLYIINGISLAFIEDKQKEAVASFEKAIELDPKDPELWFHKAHYYVRRSDFGTAIDILKEGIAKHPDSGELHLNLGALLRHVGNMQESIMYHRKGLEILNRLVHYGFFLVDENNQPLEEGRIAMESDRIIPREKVAAQFIAQLKDQGHEIDEKGLVDGKYRIGMKELSPDEIKFKENVKVL